MDRPLNHLLADRKNAIRKAAHAARRLVGEKTVLGRRITDRLTALPEYQSAKSVMWYIDVRDEAPTRHVLPSAIASEKTIIVPYCVEGELELFALESMEELETGMYSILEPKKFLRGITGKNLAVNDIDLIVVPGVAFGASGERIGHGKGYYDKLLSRAKPQTVFIALAMQCQIFEDIPMQDHDIYMDKVVTEDTVYVGRGRRP